MIVLRIWGTNWGTNLLFMASLKYFLRESKTDFSSIYLRFKHGTNFDFKISTEIKIPKDRWSDSKQQILVTDLVDYRTINSKLKELDLYINDEFEKSKISQETIILNQSWLKNLINKFFNRSEVDDVSKKEIYFSEFIVSFIEDSKTKRNRLGNPIKPRTIQHYNTTLNKINQFENHTNIKLKIIDVDLKFHSRFIEFLEKNQKLNPNTIGGYIDDIKLFINYAERKDLKINKETKSSEFYSPTNKTQDIYLNEEEINSIYKHKFEDDYLDNARDWFIIGLRTGLRISDFLKLSNKNLNEGFIELQTIKTDFPVIIPIHQQVQSILDKRKGKFPRTISDQKFNSYIKIVCEKVGLNEVVFGAKMVETNVIENNKKKIIHRKKAGNFPKYELVSSHICRRSFATNLYGKIDTLTIMKITGHKTESQFLSYIKITPKQYAEKLKEYWRKNG